ncbi:MAG TPA: DUF58 domain-containing protein [Gaiellaceae bacterium]|nr:DUF58 domain-containing protein [Gaiellaceae bacterium]
MPARERNVFPLVPRYRVAGLPLGGRASLRRGHGTDVAGSRAYVRGDPISTIDWRASARLSTARDRDEFVVRERYAEEAPRVVVVRDRRPAMRLYRPPLRFLDKGAAVDAAVGAIAASAQAVNSSVAYVDHGEGGEAHWLPPGGRGALERIEARGRADADRAPADAVARALEFLSSVHGELSSGSFVFVLSDFLGTAVPETLWLTVAARRWEAVPVVVQDPTWESGFPAVPGVVLPLADAESGAQLDVRVSRREAARLHEQHARRRDELLDRFRLLGLEPVLLDTSEPDEIVLRFFDWAERRRDLRSRR